MAVAAREVVSLSDKIAPASFEAVSEVVDVSKAKIGIEGSTQSFDVLFVNMRSKGSSEKPSKMHGAFMRTSVAETLEAGKSYKFRFSGVDSSRNRSDNGLIQTSVGKLQEILDCRPV